MQQTETLWAQNASGETASAPAPSHRHFKTEGERKFNWQTYTGLGYFANVGVSLAAVFWAERTHTGQKAISAFGRGMQKLGVAAEKAEFAARKSFFLVGGFAVIPFMKHSEDHKAERVEKYNRDSYGAQAAADPLIVQSEREVRQAPQQGWASIISGRGLALLPFYATTMLLWSSTSKLAKATNGALYFDKPLATLTRDFGKLLSSKGKYFDGVAHEVAGANQLYHGALRILGKPLRLLPENRAAVQQIEQMERISPGSIQSVKKGAHDPIHAVMPYYVISEAITSAIVAWGLFLITRVTGPVFDKKTHEVPAMDDAAMIAPAAIKPAASAPATQIATQDAARSRLQPAMGEKEWHAAR